MAKPVGPVCNLACQYCFYLEKQRYCRTQTKWRMSEAVLEAYVRQYISSQPVSEVHFAWQGGEPTLLGVDFYRKAVALQARYAGTKTVFNSIQTNGTLLDTEWCEFFAANNFLVGISIDGPAELHNAYRHDKLHRPTFERVMRGLDLLKKYKVEFNTLTVVHRLNAEQPLEVYRFLKNIGSRFIQFIPLVERAAPAHLHAEGYIFSEPTMPSQNANRNPPDLMHWSVAPEQYGTFLCTVFDEWVRHDVGKVFVQLFDVTLSNWLGLGSGLCAFAERCGRALVLEHNGDVYSCDHYVYPPWKLGNIMHDELAALAVSAPQVKFGNDKFDTLATVCRSCSVLFLCNGGCPKHRFLPAPNGEYALSYLCTGYKKFFRHVAPYMQTMAWLLETNQAPARIMEFLASRT